MFIDVFCKCRFLFWIHEFSSGARSMLFFKNVLRISLGLHSFFFEFDDFDLCSNSASRDCATSVFDFEFDDFDFDQYGNTL